MAKLLDILVRELKVWPEGIKSLALNINRLMDEANYPVDLNISTLGFDGHLSERVTHPQWQAAVDALKADECAHDYANKLGCPECGEAFKVEWNGEGVPPAGAVCEYLTIDKGEFWCKATVKYIGEHLLIVGYQHPTDGDQESCMNHKCKEGPGIETRLRPIRTPEQVAADNRLHEIRNALTAIRGGQSSPNDLVLGNSIVATVEAMIDAGYRKRETTNES